MLSSSYLWVGDSRRIQTVLYPSPSYTDYKHVHIYQTIHREYVSCSLSSYPKYLVYLSTMHRIYLRVDPYDTV